MMLAAREAASEQRQAEMTIRITSMIEVSIQAVSPNGLRVRQPQRTRR